MFVHVSFAQVVNGADHPGAIGPPPANFVPPPASIPESLVDTPLTGWKSVLDEEGPEGWAKAVRNHKGVLLTDTTWYDKEGEGGEEGYIYQGFVHIVIIRCELIVELVWCRKVDT